MNAVYKAITKVQATLAKEGIGKDKTANAGGSFKFRGIDDIYNAISLLMAENDLCVIPRIISREQFVRDREGGKFSTTVVVKAEYDFVSSDDGSKCTVETFGEATDTSDKATNKAMSAAQKYAFIQAFCIPTEADPAAEEERLKKQQEEINAQVMALEKEAMIAIDAVDNAAAYAVAREAVVPVVLRLKQLAPAVAVTYENKMVELKAKYVTNRPATVGSILGGNA